MSFPARIRANATLYHGSTRYFLPEVFWDETRGERLGKTPGAVEPDDRVTAYIPLAGYVSPGDALQEENACCWTVEKGDALMKGDIPDIIERPVELEKKYGLSRVFRVQRVEVMDFGGARLRHVRVTAR